MNRPSLSIVLVTRNRLTYLRRALASVLDAVDLEYPDAEILVVDGASTDGTAEYLANLSTRLKWWVSEPDSSVGDAVNKGLRRSSGRTIRLIGDDDEIVPGGLNIPMQFLDSHPEYGAVAGQNRVVIESAEGTQSPYEQMKLEGDITLARLRQFPVRGFFIPECLFLRREALDRVGGYDESFRYWGYLDWFFRLVKGGVRIHVIPDVILTTYQTPASDSIRANGSPRWKEEWARIQRTHNTLYGRIWHEGGGRFQPVRYAVRKLTSALFGRTPRELFRRRESSPSPPPAALS